MKHVLWSVLGLAAVLSGNGLASTGGNEAAAILGFDAKTSRLYWAVYDHSESGQFPQVMWLSLDSTEAGPHLYESVTQVGHDYKFWLEKSNRQLDSLRTRLKAPTSLSPKSIKLSRYARSRGYCSETNAYGRTTQTIWELRAIYGSYSGGAFVAAFCRDSLGVSWAGRIPQQRWVIAIVTYPGIPYEGCYTRDQVMVLRRK